MRVLLVTPPMIQINTPYPATAYLKSYLESKGNLCRQIDLSLELILKLFSEDGLTQVYDLIVKQKNKLIKSDSVHFFLEAFEDYKKTVRSVVQFLQGKDPSLALRIANRKMLPEGPRFLHLQEHSESLLSQFGEMGTQDKAKFIASLYLDDLADVLRDAVDPDFQFSRYAEHLASSQNSFDGLYSKINSSPNLFDQYTEHNFLKHFNEFNPDLVAITIPFPGNLYSALRIGRLIKKQFKNVKVVVGGGFVNTELRNMNDIRFFEFVDFMTFDDGERPLEILIEHLSGKIEISELIRTKYIFKGKVLTSSAVDKAPLKFNLLTGPDYSDLPLNQYISMLELPNPMHRMWSDFRWNKMILAHGCYWKKCSFCDTNLDYISRFEPGNANSIVDQMTRIANQTGFSGFHFVDEAAPPALLRTVSKEIIKRKLQFTWWGNLRFDKQFDKELCELMAEAGCVAVTGGLEVASPRLLKLINKGVSVEQVAQVTRNFRDAGIFVHAYLMYGFPTQTTQETIDSLEVVKQLFNESCLNSAHWHRFLATIHSDVANFPSQYGIQLTPKKKRTPLFAEYEIPFKETNQANHDVLGIGLRKALYNYMHNIGLEQSVNSWFDFKTPKPSIKSNFIRNALKKSV